MMENLRHVPWEDIQHAIPAFLTVAIIPLTYSIAYGIIAGITSYFFIWLAGTLWDICAIPVTGR